MKIRIDPLDTLFSEYVRKRAMARVHGCERCLRGKAAYSELQCCHFHGRSRKSVRWDEDNAAGLCMGCHVYLDSHPLEKVQFFQERLGDGFDLLTARASQTYPRPDREALGLYFKAKLREVL